MSGRTRRTWDDDVKTRYIYILVFFGKRVYVGQSVNYRRRIKAHLRAGWNEQFMPVVVERINDSEAGGVDHEYAWRWCAHVNGWFPIYQSSEPFDTGIFWPETRAHGESLVWPFSI